MSQRKNLAPAAITRIVTFDFVISVSLPDDIIERRAPRRGLLAALK